jgi:Arm DNA-binding domain
MPEAKSHIGSWGGTRKGASRKRELTLSDRRQVASDYFARQQKGRDRGDKPHRYAIIEELRAEYGVTHRMVVRCLDDFLRETKDNVKMYTYATEGDGIQPLPADEKEVEKLRSGIYADEKLRLIVDPAGNRKWVFRFFWRRIVTDLMLGGSEVSLATARECATVASRMLATGQNPIDGSWSSSALQSLRSKLDFGINRRDQGGIVGLIANHLNPRGDGRAISTFHRSR